MANLFARIDVSHRALDYHLERHNVLSGNIANVDTPGFRPRELVRETERTSPATLPLTATDPRHAGSLSASERDRYEVREEEVVGPGNDENSVSLERELSKLAANHLRYETAARVVQTQLGQLRYAASDGNG